MNENETYTPSTHPLALIYEAGLLRSFRRQSSGVICPMCHQTVDVFIYKPADISCFFLCRHCAWFQKLHTLDPVLKNATRRKNEHYSPNNFNHILDQTIRKITPPGVTPDYGFARLSGQKRCSRR